MGQNPEGIPATCFLDFPYFFLIILLIIIFIIHIYLTK